jgi:hypothetical protein
VVKNDGPTPLVDVIVRVTGSSYAIGDLGVGESRSVAVRGGGPIEIELSENAGRRSRREVKSAYF